MEGGPQIACLDFARAEHPLFCALSSLEKIKKGSGDFGPLRLFWFVPYAEEGEREREGERGICAASGN